MFQSLRLAARIMPCSGNQALSRDSREPTCRSRRHRHHERRGGRDQARVHQDTASPAPHRIQDLQAPAGCARGEVRCSWREVELRWVEVGVTGRDFTSLTRRVRVVGYSSSLASFAFASVTFSCPFPFPFPRHLLGRRQLYALCSTGTSSGGACSCCWTLNPGSLQLLIRSDLRSTVIVCSSLVPQYCGLLSRLSREGYWSSTSARALLMRSARHACAATRSLSHLLGRWFGRWFAHVPSVCPTRLSKLPALPYLHHTRSGDSGPPLTFRPHPLFIMLERHVERTSTSTVDCRV